MAHWSETYLNSVTQPFFKKIWEWKKCKETFISFFELLTMWFNEFPISNPYITNFLTIQNSWNQLHILSLTNWFGIVLQALLNFAIAFGSPKDLTIHHILQISYCQIVLVKTPKKTQIKILLLHVTCHIFEMLTMWFHKFPIPYPKIHNSKFFWNSEFVKLHLSPHSVIDLELVHHKVVKESSKKKL